MIDILQWIVIGVLILWVARLNYRDWGHMEAIEKITNVIAKMNKISELPSHPWPSVFKKMFH